MFDYNEDDFNALIEIAEETEDELFEVGVPVIDVIFVLEDGTWVSSAGE